MPAFKPAGLLDGHKPALVRLCRTSNRHARADAELAAGAHSGDDRTLADSAKHVGSNPNAYVYCHTHPWLFTQWSH